MSDPTPFDASVAINHFGLNLYRQLAPGHATGNLVLSPYSLATALAMTSAGAAGITRAELDHALHFSSNEPEVQNALGALHLGLAASAQRTVDALPERRRWMPGAEAIELNCANRLFIQEGCFLRPDYLARVEKAFGAVPETADFRNHPGPVREKINAWVEAQTHDRIRHLIPPGGIDRSTRLALVNALYFKAPWAGPFKTSATTMAPFHLPTESPTTAPILTMRATGYYPYFQNGEFSVLAIPYQEGEFQFVIFLPATGHALKTSAALVSSELLLRAARLGEADLQYVSLHLPKFEVPGNSLALSDPLGELGIRAGFDKPAGSADFSRMGQPQPPDYFAMSEVFHQTFLAIDETGTEAAAATAMVAVAGGVARNRPKPIEFRVDRPFLFAIQHVPTGTCLLFGHIADPR
jgi:serpin B